MIVIGAGFAGLSATRLLKTKGYDVTVLEASDRLGGRVKTKHQLGTPIERMMVENFFASPAEELGFANLIPKSATQAQTELLPSSDRFVVGGMDRLSGSWANYSKLRRFLKQFLHSYRRQLPHH
ncbi:amine oxidase [Nostoc commune NIES-4072]|uniref:Amine oxidase n=1 Tax=Nostoc commune NIES-4072 TaxID=2005467 RepID=A0A2R5FHW9_NOSCO|nr:FAD-dependent oxidoreductase [Nostoc commune]BBD64413.1 amine oxidase [Nostoc commune HK-02]GBG18260.1 amine oxidase [Nostoc commune NIES-4072]